MNISDKNKLYKLLLLFLLFLQKYKYILSYVTFKND